MPTVTIDGQPITVPEGATILEAAREIGIEIPTLCYREDLPAQTSCMVCVVRIEGQKRFVPSCAMRARDGMVIEAQSVEVQQTRRTALELLLSDHIGDCLGPCQLACAAGLNIPRMIRQIVAGDLPGAMATVRERIPLPATLGRICPAPCENACRRGAHDEAVSVRLLKRWVGDAYLASETPRMPEAAPASGRRVAIVGAGPAGLSAAYYLCIAGHQVAIFEERNASGGGLRDADNLAWHVLDAEIDTILQMGVDLRAESRVGRDLPLDELREAFDAVLLAVGELDEKAAAELGVPFAGRGIEVDRMTHQSPIEGVFACGSAQAPSRLAIRAVAMGRESAQAIDQYVGGQDITPEERPFNVTLGRLETEEAARMAVDANERPRLIPSGGEFVGFNDEEAVREALRCMHCDCHGLRDCRLRALSEKLGASPRIYRAERRRFQRDNTHPAIVFEPGKCVTCGLCVEIARRDQEELGLVFIDRGFNVRTSVPFGATLAEGLQRAAEDCARACPTGAIVLREDQEERQPHDGA